MNVRGARALNDWVAGEVQGLLEVFIILFSDMKRRKDGIGV